VIRSGSELAFTVTLPLPLELIGSRPA
jgi:hypothetical protein